MNELLNEWTGNNNGTPCNLAKDHDNDQGQIRPNSSSKDARRHNGRVTSSDGVNLRQHGALDA